MNDLHNGEVTQIWEDDGIIFINSCHNVVTLTMPALDFLKFVSELNKAASKVAELQMKEFEEKYKQERHNEN